VDKTSHGNGHKNGNGNSPHDRDSGKRVKRNAADRRRAPPQPQERRLGEVLNMLQGMVEGEFQLRMPVANDGSMLDRIAHTVNDLNARHEQMKDEIVRIERVVGREGRMDDRARIANAKGGWKTKVDTINQLVADLVMPTTEISRLLGAVARGDLTQKMALEFEG
jgi:hypothetical protein